MSQIESIRRKITRDYCRTILWVDDQIKLEEIDEALTERYKSLFLPTAQAIHRHGVICQLQPISQTGSTGDPDETPEELSAVKKMARTADVLILDWHLAGVDPAHCVSIIEDLLGEQETRFILILTQHKNVIEEFNNRFNGRFSIDGDFALSPDGKHVAFMQKPTDGGDATATSILSVIERLMTTAYPDFIHWAALEIAASIKKFTPRWLGTLPREMDWALLSEYCFGKHETATLVIENLLEDLGHCIHADQLQATSPENCRGEDWAKLKEHFSDIQKLEDGVAIDLLGLKASPPDLRNGLPEVLRNPTQKVVREFVDSQKLFDTFCENISLSLDAETRILPGAIFKKSDNGGSREIYVCVSQACDCLRAGHLLFIRGKKEKAPKLGSTILKFQQQCYRFDAEAKNLLNCKIAGQGSQRMPEGLQKIGQLRAAAARRLATRFWNYSTRSAVNISTFARAERSGE